MPAPLVWFEIPSPFETAPGSVLLADPPKANIRKLQAMLLDNRGVHLGEQLGDARGQWLGVRMGAEAHDGKVEVIADAGEGGVEGEVTHGGNSWSGKMVDEMPAGRNVALGKRRIKG